MFFCLKVARDLVSRQKKMCFFVSDVFLSQSSERPRLSANNMCFFVGDVFLSQSSERPRLSAKKMCFFVSDGFLS